MENTTSTSQPTPENLKKELEESLRRNMGQLFERYGLDLETHLIPFKWKSLVLVIGNYSSGKSTFINEFLGMDVQMTGQSPTDDSFTILTAPEPEHEEGEVPGGTVVNTDELPFGSLRRFGQTLLAHLRLKRIPSSLLEEMAIIDTPGMLDSVTEKDRGYEYLGVVGELARLADLIILMFDPHKAGTIKETYQAIRSTLPEATGQDRTLFVLNRIDECDNVKDLVRSYGTLCWNLSQMTGRKDMPRIYLTYASQPAGDREEIPLQDEALWKNERDELKKAILSAPRLRLDHILHDVDRVSRELRLQVEALAAFQRGLGERLKKVVRNGVVSAVLAFFLGDLLFNLLTGSPGPSFLEAMVSGKLTAENFLWPAFFAMSVLVLTFLYLQYLLFPRFIRKTLSNLDELISLETPYKHDLWHRVRERVRRQIADQGGGLLWVRHKRNLRLIDQFLHRDLRRFYQRLQQ